MQLNELPEQGQPEPGRLDLFVRRAHMLGFLEDRFLTLRCNADAGVGDRDLTNLD